MRQHNSPQQGSSKTLTITIKTPKKTQFQTNTSTTQPIHRTLQYTPVHTSLTQNRQPVLTINTLHTNPLSNFTTSRNLSRPIIPTIPNNPLSYDLKCTSANVQSSSTNVHHNTTQYAHFQTNIPSTTIRTNPYTHTISTHAS